ncbi:MAG: hypothetical protein CM1200mP22_17510 [Dehalococcoidia bacterium]|nr:MAG: hypothetical protein CM1200mP22_17510 [Dehalococcoidia bacterium]
MPERERKIVGWAALSPVSSRSAYAGVAEVSVYVSEQNRGTGVGKLLLSSLVSTSESAGIWTLQAMIFVENKASIALHSSCGFRTVGTRERIGSLPAKGETLYSWNAVATSLETNLRSVRDTAASF